jgi:aldose 1-epimerase
MTRHFARGQFGVGPGGEVVELHTLTNPSGMRVRTMTYGGIIVSLEVPDRDGLLGDVVLGYENLKGYLHENPYFGAIVGRYGNRIGGARFELDGEVFELAPNDGGNHLHGGRRGFDKVVWEAEPFASDSSVGLVLSYTSPDGEEGYPGTLQAQVTYTLTDANELIVDYLATTDRPTPVNLTQHSYFNLAGPRNVDILDHELFLAADHITPVDATLIPTGEIAPVDGTPFDFRTPHPIGARIDAEDPQILFGGGYDHNFVLSGAGSGDEADGLVLAARVFEPLSGRTLEVLTTEPGVQFYSGNFLDGSITGKEGAVFGHRSGFCLETQHFPDSPNQPAFPSTILRPGEEYRSRTVFRFGIR